ncbi:MAG: xanthine dehydrogenase family protein subunit M [Nitriliruptoraceae bacterium]|nr:xanthine dehydrogenase family protein subunit M [Nitriliruptoraceae bacterium]
MSSGFTIEEPRSVDEALTLLAQGDETVRAIAGGTGLSLLMKYGFFEPATLVSLRHLRSSLADIEVTPDGGVRLGAMATLRDLEDAPIVAERLPLLRQALGRLATVRLRNAAQLGGAIAHGHPQMDTPPVLLALDAQVQVASIRGARTIAAQDMFLGYYETAVEDDELILEVRIPPQGEHRATYRKITARAEDDWPMLGIAALVATDGGRISRARVALGALTDRPMRLPDVESALQGSDPGSDEVEAIARDAAAALDLYDKPAASAAYQRHIVAVHLRRALLEILDLGDGSSKGGR